eukprot:4912056-Pleurochrysis_carterae.AAC.1
MAERYSIFSQNRPHTAAAFTASAILGAADVSSQFLQHWIPQRRRLLGAETKFCRDMSIDWRRTAGLTTFGFIHYGGACKLLRRQRFLSKPFCSRLKAQQAKAFNHRSD